MNPTRNTRPLLVVFFAIWLADSEGNFLQTLYVSESIRTGFKELLPGIALMRMLEFRTFVIMT